jgi:hypothetical protein|tara:strand:- start:382 stop:858 length:477 start_codon:yes stop_codon:yes gene_type:complete
VAQRCFKASWSAGYADTAWVFTYSAHKKTPVYHCIDSEQSGHCQNVRANQVDAEVERLLIEALQPDRIDLALAAHEQMNGENRLLERQWALNREKAHYEAERARRQYDAVESEKRLVARSLETLWEEKIREADASNRITRGGMSSRLTPWPPPRERVS